MNYCNTFDKNHLNSGIFARADRFYSCHCHLMKAIDRVTGPQELRIAVVVGILVWGSMFEMRTHWSDSCQTTPTSGTCLLPQCHPEKMIRPPFWFSGGPNTLGL